MSRSSDKGKRGEREVVAIFRDHGYDRASRSPGSGSLRPYGPRDSSPWPGDLAFVEPWLVEVKWDERMNVGGGRTWPGSSFVKGTLRALEQTANRSVIIGRSTPIPALFARGSFSPWRVFVPETVLLAHVGGPGTIHRVTGRSYVELDVETFFDLDGRRRSGAAP